jgi:hydrogenase nickel incorporation protein HypA/HybF
MHELGLCSSIVDAIERRAGERPVAKVRVRVGRLHHVHPEAFDQSFAVAALGTVAEGAAAELVLLPVRARCATCGKSWDGDDIPVACPECGEMGVELIGGDELVLESIEYAG